VPQSLAETLQSIRASLAGQDRARGESESIRLAFLFIELHERARAPERARLLEEAEKYPSQRSDSAPSKTDPTISSASSASSVLGE
jgi:hypothetical protein